jgi:hypothetical protein
MKNKIVIVLVSLLLASINFQCARRTAGTAAAATDEAATDLQQYVGTYRIDSDEISSATVTFEDGRLYGQADGQPKTELRPESGDTFNVANMGAKVEFIRDSQQQVNGVKILYQGYEFVGQKVE